MKEKLKKWCRTALFTALGVLAGLAYYRFEGCSTGACPVASNPWICMVYIGSLGWLLSVILEKESDDTCNT